MNAVMSKRIPTDQLQREMAIGAGSFIVEAPAGSGKTSILIKRFLHLLLKVDEPTDVIAITFTNKAAMEMRLRIEEALMKKNDEERELIEAIWQRAKKLGWSLRFNEDLRIMTIDKLATQIVNQTSIFENLGRNYYTDENPEEIYIQSIKEVVNESQYIKTLLKNQNNDTSKIIQQLVDAIKKRGQWLPRLLKFKDKNMGELSQDYSNYSRSEIKEILNKIGQNFNSNEKNEIFGFVDEIHSSTKHAEEWQTWLAFAKIIFTSNHDIRKKFDIRQGISNDENGKKLKVKIKNFLNKNIHKINVLKLIFKVDYLNKYDHFLPIVPDLLLILVATCEKLNGKFLAQKIHDFEQIMINANQALEQTNLAEILDMNIEHILVDEFQDINYSQLRFLELLTQNFGASESKTFFAVGDPMQSIYRFRKAEVEIFSRLQLNKKLGEDLEIQPLYLNTNFRSNTNIIDCLNNTFANLFPSEDDLSLGRIAYKPVIQGGEEISGEGVHYQLLDIETDNKRIREKEEANYIAKKLEELRELNPNATIAVLARSRSHLNDLLPIIKREYSSLAIQAVKIFPVSENQAFVDILTLTKALFNFDDRVSWMTVLKSPWIGLTNVDFVKLFEIDHEKTVWETINDKTVVSSLSKSSQSRLNYFANIIKKNICIRSRVSNRFFIESIWTQLNGQYALIHESDLEIIDIFLGLIEKYSKSLISIDFEGLERQIENERLNTSAHSLNPIQFLTIHNAKGLQFDIVLIPGMNKQVQYENKSLFYIDKGYISIIHENDDKDLYDYHRENELERIANEQIRLLYIAISRAKKECYMIGSLNKTKEDEDRHKHGSFQKIISAVMQPKVISIKPKLIAEDYAEFTPKLRRLKDTFFINNNNLNFEDSLDGINLAAKDNTNNIFIFTGEIIHKYFELIIKNQLDIDFILGKKLSYIEALFTNQRFSNSEIKLGLGTLNQSLQHLQKKEVGKWIYKLHKEDYLESRYIFIDELGSKRTLIPDRSFVDNGIRWLIDYKTVFNETNLKSHAGLYKSQLDTYAKIFNDNYPIKKAIYFCKDGELICVD